MSNPVEETSPLADIRTCSCTKGAPSTQEAFKARKSQAMERETLIFGKMTTGSVMSELCCKVPAVHKGRGSHERLELFTRGCWQKLVFVIPVGTANGFCRLSSG